MHLCREGGGRPDGLVGGVEHASDHGVSERAMGHRLAVALKKGNGCG